MSVKNFVQCGLVTPVAANTTELVLKAPTASYQYPPLDGGTLVIADSMARPTFYEIISYTHRIDNVLYGVVRAKEGTTARAWTGTTWIYQALTAQDYVDALALKAPLASPALTGVPTAPTAPLGTNTQQIATMAAVQAAIANLIASSPAALDTLNELAAALGNDPNFATTINNALAGKEPTIVAGTSAQMWLGNKTWASVLTQVQNTLLTGLGAGSNATILTTDTLIGALAKIQNQLNNKANFTDSRLSDAREWTATEVSQAEAQAGTATVARKWTALRVWQAVLASSLTGLNLTVGTAVTATDTVLVAIGKLQKQITDAASNLAGSVRATVLTGYVTGSNAVLASTDTVLAAFGKLQAQITGLATSKLDATANAVSASKLATARSIALAGDVTGSANFDGSANVSINAALPARLGKTAQVITDWDLATENGYFQGTDALNAPLAGWVIGHVISHGGAGWVTQDVFSFAGDSSADSKAFRRERNNGTWGPWYRLRTTEAEQSALYNNASNLSSGTVPDARLSGTYTGVNITGNAATASKLQTARTINGVSFDGTANITVADATKLPLTGGTMSGTVALANGTNDSPELLFVTPSYTVHIDVEGDYFRAFAQGGASFPFQFNLSTNRAYFFGSEAWHTGNFNPNKYLPLAGGTMTGNILMSGGGGSGNGLMSGNGDGASYLTNNLKISSWYGIGFGPSITGHAVPAGEYSHWFDTRSGNAGIRGAITVGGRATVGDIYSNGWLRTIGERGWYNETYGGGIYMADSTYVRVYNSKAFYCNGNEIVLEGYSPTMRFYDNTWGNRYIHANDSLIGFLSDSFNWSFRVDNDGNAIATGNVTAYSDIRLKKDIELIPDALDKVCALRGVTYERIDSGERQTGVIAQEVQAVLPEAVMTMNDDDKTLSVAYGNMVGLLIEAIKELRAEVEELKNGTA